MSEHNERLEVSRVIKAERERLFATWTDPALIVKWWGAGDIRCTAAEMDLQVGGRYRIANQGPDGATMWITGTFDHIDPPNGLSYTWAVEPVASDTEFSQVDVSFDPHPDGTLVTIRHERIPSPDAREMNRLGWLGCLEGLAALLSPASG